MTSHSGAYKPGAPDPSQESLRTKILPDQRPHLRGSSPTHTTAAEVQRCSVSAHQTPESLCISLVHPVVLSGHGPQPTSHFWHEPTVVETTIAVPHTHRTNTGVAFIFTRTEQFNITPCTPRNKVPHCRCSSSRPHLPPRCKLLSTTHTICRGRQEPGGCC